MGQFESVDILIALLQFFDERPSGIMTAVIDIDDVARLDLAFGNEAVYQLRELLRGFL
jgi:hypothetical protein